MSSRYLAAIAAWVLGVAIATAGSLIAVNELAHGLLSQPAQELVGTKARETHPTPAPSSSPASSVTPSPAGRPATGGAAPPAASAAPPPQPGTFLSSPDGSVVASCQAGGAYLQYWSPAQGFEADDVARGPAAVASVTFQAPAGGIVMRVSCTNGTPAAQLTQLPPEPRTSASPP